MVLRDDVLACKWTEFMLANIEDEHDMMPTMAQAVDFGHAMVKVTKGLGWNEEFRTPDGTESRIWYRAFAYLKGVWFLPDRSKIEGRPDTGFHERLIRHELLWPASEIVKFAQDGDFTEYNDRFEQYEDLYDPFEVESEKPWTLKA